MKTSKSEILSHLLPTMLFWLLLVACSPDGRSIVPSVPTNVTARAQSSTSIVITWSPVDNATSYDVHYESASTPLSKVTTVSNSTSYTHSDLQPNTAYDYYVTAKNGAGISDYSSRARVTTPLNDAGGQRPDTPTGVTAALQSSRSIRVTWNVAPGASSYDVYYTVSSTPAMNFADSIISPPYTHSNLQSGMSYCYYVKAKNSAGESDLSSPSTFIAIATNPTPSGTYTVTFNANGGIGTVPTLQTVQTGSSITLPSGSGLSKSGFTFGGWNTNTSGTGTNYSAGSSFTPTGNITLYAKWNTGEGTTTTYTITFNANGGSGTVPTSQTVQTGSSITLPNGSGLSKSSFTFGGWNTNTSGTGTNYSVGSSFTPNSNVTLYAKWDSVGGSNPDGIESVTGLANKLTWLKTNAVNGGNYILEVSSDESISPQTLSFGKSNITITLRGIGTNRNISLLSSGSLFTVPSGVTLILDNNITLFGLVNNTASLVYIYSGGHLIMNSGSTVTGNTTLYGGGVYVSNGSFTMNGGTISNNTAVLSSWGQYTSYGGGVYIDSGTFTMNGGSIIGNICSNSSFSFTSVLGGGVYIAKNGKFDMTGGIITGNSSSYLGGGVYVDNSILNKTGGTITGYDSDQSNGNVVRTSTGIVQSNRGHAVYASANGIIIKQKETTAGTGVNLVFNSNSGVFSGGWDN